MDQTVRDGERNQTELASDEIREELIQVKEGNGYLYDAICDVCFIRTLSSVDVNIALYLCYICNKYLCQDCFKEHESHRFFKKSEKERMKKCFHEMIYESESERKKMFDREDVSMVDRVNVNHELDKSDNCWITGLCGLDDTRWVVCDYYNYCIKIFSIGSHILQRFIRFGSAPYGVTVIKVKREHTEQGIMAASVSSGIKVKKLNPLNRLRAAIKAFFSVKRESTEQGLIPTTDMSVTNTAEPDIQCLLAVTLPWQRRIVFINLTQNPAVITKSIKTEKHCWAIDFSGDQIFALCKDKNLGDCPWFVTVMSTDGVTIKTINTPLHSYWYPDLAVCPGRFYLTGTDNHKVLCMNDKGKVVSHKTIEWSRPCGISVDPDTNNIYICSAWGHYTVYRLDSRLESFESLLDLELVDSGRHNALCVYRNRLYVGHGLSTHVTVVRVL